MGLASQNIEEHQWKNRIILLISNTEESELLINQLEEFNTNNEKSYAYWSPEVVKKNYKLQKQIIQNTIGLLKK
jgi:hypothetical protein